MTDGPHVSAAEARRQRDELQRILAREAQRYSEALRRLADL